MVYKIRRINSKKFSLIVAALEELDKKKTDTLEGLVGILQIHKMNHLEVDQDKTITLKSQFDLTNYDLDEQKMAFSFQMNIKDIARS